MHWFGLSDGWYWWQVGSQNLFQYSLPTLDHLAEKYTHYHSELPYEDYQIARLWEDLLASLPAILDPVPDDLIERTGDVEKWQIFQRAAFTWADTQTEKEAGYIPYKAFQWWWKRTWDAGYLRCPPSIWLWTQGNTFHIRWDNRNVADDNLPVWEATAGEIIIPMARFIEEAKSFNDRLMSQMADRVSAVVSRALRPEIAIDIDGLLRDHEERVGRLANILEMPHEKQNWDEVRTAISTIERMCYNNGVEGL